MRFLLLTTLLATPIKSLASDDGMFREAVEKPDCMPQFIIEVPDRSDAEHISDSGLTVHINGPVCNGWWGDYRRNDDSPSTEKPLLRQLRGYQTPRS